MPKLRTVGAHELQWLRKRIIEKAHEKLEEIPVPNTNKEQYEELAALIRRETYNYDTQDLSTGILRKLFYYSKEKETERFNRVHLDTVYLYLTDGDARRNEFLNHFPALKKKFVVKRKREEFGIRGEGG